MSEVIFMALKDIRLLTRDRAGLFFILGFPFIYAMLIGSMFSTAVKGDARFNVAVVDEDATGGSRAYIGELTALPQLEVAVVDRAEAQRRLRRGNVAAFVVLSPGFGEARAKPLAGIPPKAELVRDPSRAAESAMLEGVLMRTAFLAMGHAISGGAPMPEPLSLESTSMAHEKEGPANAFEFSFPQGIVWAMIFCVSRFGASLVSERTHGTLVRMQMAPVSRAQIVAGKAVACLVVMSVVTLALTVFAAVVLHVRIVSVPLYLLATGSAVIGFTGIMALMSTLGKNEASTAAISSAIMLLMALTGGAAVPLIAMPEWMRTVGSISPVKWTILAAEGAIWRGFSPGEMMTPCAILLTSGVVCFLIGARSFRWETQ